jgi:hypothetical protein
MLASLTSLNLHDMLLFVGHSLLMWLLLLLLLCLLLTLLLLLLLLLCRLLSSSTAVSAAAAVQLLPVSLCYRWCYGWRGCNML